MKRFTRLDPLKLNIFDPMKGQIPLIFQSDENEIIIHLSKEGIVYFSIGFNSFSFVYENYKFKHFAIDKDRKKHTQSQLIKLKKYG